MSNSHENPLYNIERIGDVTSPLAVTDVRVTGSSDLFISGWIVDPVRKTAGSGVDVVIDGLPYLATSGIPRDDVASHFQIPAYKGSGYSFTVPARLISKGSHALAIRIITDDGKTYLESPPMKFTLL